MECQECHERPASIHFTKIINGEKMEYHLCEQCARDKGAEMTGHSAFSIPNFLSGLLNFDQQPLDSSSTNKKSTTSVQCQKCGLTYHQFTQIGKFGCEECYKTFNNYLNPILRKVHSGNTTHIGKIPKRMGSDIKAKRKIQSLKEKLQQLIESEEFEEAAKVRDEIRSLENGGNE